VWTGKTFNREYISGKAVAGHLGVMLLAVTRSGTRGRMFRAPSSADLNAIQAAGDELARKTPGWDVEDLIPRETRFVGPADRSARCGIRTFDAMFMLRQLFANVTILEELRGVIDQARASSESSR